MLWIRSEEVLQLHARRHQCSAPPRSQPRPASTSASTHSSSASASASPPPPRTPSPPVVDADSGVSNDSTSSCVHANAWMLLPAWAEEVAGSVEERVPMRALENRTHASAGGSCGKEVAGGSLRQSSLQIAGGRARWSSFWSAGMPWRRSSHRDREGAHTGWGNRLGGGACCSTI